MDGAIDSDRRQEARMQATATWELPAGWVRISSQTWGPFVIRELVRRPDGEVVEFTARRHRKGYGPRRAPRPTGSTNSTELGRPHAVLWAPREIGWWVGVLFMIGSTCFAVGSVPSLSEVVSAKVISSIYFIGSLFFTSAGYLQYVQASSASGTGEHVAYQWFGVKPHGLGWWAAAVQLLGTLFFNVTTFRGTEHGVHRAPAEPASVVSGLLWLDLLLDRELVRGERGGCAWPAPVALE
jgi:hypothetical protein